MSLIDQQLAAPTIRATSMSIEREPGREQPVRLTFADDDGHRIHLVLTAGMAAALSAKVDRLGRRR